MFESQTIYRLSGLRFDKSFTCQQYSEPVSMKCGNTCMGEVIFVYQIHSVNVPPYENTLKSKYFFNVISSKRPVYSLQIHLIDYSSARVIINTICDCPYCVQFACILSICMNIVLRHNFSDAQYREVSILSTKYLK